MAPSPAFGRTTSACEEAHPVEERAEVLHVPRRAVRVIRPFARRLLVDDEPACIVHQNHEFDRERQERHGRVRPETALAGDAEPQAGRAHAEPRLGDRCLEHRAAAGDFAGEGAERIGIDGAGKDEPHAEARRERG